MSTKLHAACFAALLVTGACALAQTPAAPPVAIASQETNFPGVVADVTEFKRKGNTLTAKVRFHNTGTGNSSVDFRYGMVYLLDADGGKKYEVLKDEKDVYIAAVTPGYSDRFSVEVAPGQAQTAWMKFPAPPATVKTVTLQVSGAPPFEDLPILDQ